MQSVHGRTERKLIVLNKHSQPIGPTIATVQELSSFLGTLARNSTFCPLTAKNWKKVNTKKDMWKYVKEKYNIPDTGRKWVLKTIQDAWRTYKCRLKKRHYKAYCNDEVRMEKRPRNISESEFKVLLDYWNSDEAQKMFRTNTENRKKLRYPHTVGKRSFAIIREAEMEGIQTRESEDDGQSVDVFASVIGPEHPGRVRLYGRGVTKTILKDKVGDPGSSTGEQMRQKMDEIEERMTQKLLEKLEEQRNTMQQEIAINIIARLQCLNPGLQLDPDMLAFCASARSHLPGETSSSQGGENEEIEDESMDGDLS